MSQLGAKEEADDGMRQWEPGQRGLRLTIRPQEQLHGGQG